MMKIIPGVSGNISLIYLIKLYGHQSSFLKYNFKKIVVKY